MKKLLITLALTTVMCSNVLAEVLVLDDNFKDGGRNNGVDENDVNWWTTTSSSAIEIKKGYLGLVSGSSGRGIRTTFEPQLLGLGDSIRATFKFTTPATIGRDRESGLRVGMFSKDGRTELESDLSASSKEPNAAYDNLGGFMVDFDVNLDDESKANIHMRKQKVASTGRLLGAISGYTTLDSGGNKYRFEPNQTYTGIMILTNLFNGVQVYGALFHKGKELSSHSTFSEGSNADDIGMLAFHVNSNTFGSSKDTDTPDNGIDLEHVKVIVWP